MKSLAQMMKSAEAEVIVSEVQDVAVDFLDVIIDLSPGKMIQFLRKCGKEFMTIPDRIFFKKLSWFLDDWNHLKLSADAQESMSKRLNQVDKEEFSFQLMDTIHKAYGKKQIHFTANSLKYALAHEEENRWLEEFYRVIFVILNTDVYSLEFLVEQLNLTDTMSRKQYSYNEKVQGLLSSGLMAADVFESSLTAGPGEQKYLFTPMADTVYKYIKDRI